MEEELVQLKILKFKTLALILLPITKMGSILNSSKECHLNLSRLQDQRSPIPRIAILIHTSKANQTFSKRLKF